MKNKDTCKIFTWRNRLKTKKLPIYNQLINKDETTHPNYKTNLKMNCIFESKAKKKKQSWNENVINIKAKL